MSFEHFALANDCLPCPPCRFCPTIGHNYASKHEQHQGRYWYYEDEHFVIDVHDLFYHVDTFHDRKAHLDSSFTLSAIYFFTANGEFFAPYQVIAPHSLLLMKNPRQAFSYLIHGQSALKAVGVHFKMAIEEPWWNKLETLTLLTEEDTLLPIKQLARQVIDHPADAHEGEEGMRDIAAKWLSQIQEAILKQPSTDSLSLEDEQTIQVVAKYITDHLALDIPQTTLEKISQMSGTKLKSTFKKKYHMTITEYTQRARMNLAETLVLNTEMDMENIAQAVGYRSQGRFSTLFKRYKGVSPSSMRHETPSIRCPRKALGFVKIKN